MVGGMNKSRLLFSSLLLVATFQFQQAVSDVHQSLSKIAIHNTISALDEHSYINATPALLGLKGQNTQWITLQYSNPNPTRDDWIGVFSPANFSASTCPAENKVMIPPFLCSAPIKYQYANFSSHDYKNTGKGLLKLQLINQRYDFSFGLFMGGLTNPKLIAMSNKVSFINPNAPVYPRLAQGKTWDEITITWTSGYGVGEAEPFVEWGHKGRNLWKSPAETLTFDRNSLCGAPAKTVGWRDPGYIHTSFLKKLWPKREYIYRLGHILFNGTIIWSQEYQFKSSPSLGQNSQQRLVIFGDMGKGEADGSNEYNNFQPGSLNTTKKIIQDLKYIDIVFHIGDICYANGYISQWDQFTAQIEPIASKVPYMIASGNHERDWPRSGSLFGHMDSGGECGVVAQTMFYVPAENREKFWYSVDYGMFRFCIANTELNWTKGTEQFEFIEKCLASVNRRKQPWLIFLSHRVLGYSSAGLSVAEDSLEEPMGREDLQYLWQKYKVDIAMYGHVHNYQRTCPMYQNICTKEEKHNYCGSWDGTIHVVTGGGGASLAEFPSTNTTWTIFKDHDFGFVKLTASGRSNLFFEYKKSSDGQVYDYFHICRDHRNILARAVGKFMTLFRYLGIAGTSWLAVLIFVRQD